MRALRYLYVLALMMWLGGMSTAGFVVAPATFAVLEDWNPTTGRVLAGRVFGAVLARLHLVAYAAAATAMLALTIQRILGPRPHPYGLRMALIGVMLGATLYSGAVLAPQIDRLQAEVNGPMNQLPTDDARRVAFDRAHLWSTSLITATIAGGLILLVWESREHA